MTPERWERIKRLFDEALDLEPGSRAAFLDGSCQDDPGLRADVERLLAAHAIAGTFMETPLLAPVDPESTFSCGDLVSDRYRIVRFVAKGGMGAIYEAHDTRLDRRVALKFLPEEFALGCSARERFEREARVIAALN